MFTPRVNHVLRKAWQWRGEIFFAFLCWQPKTPSHSGSDGAHISVYPGLRRIKQEADIGKSPVNGAIEANSTATDTCFVELCAVCVCSVH